MGNDRRGAGDAKLADDLRRVRALAARGIVERACDGCGELGESTPARSGIPIGWAKLHAQVSTWTTEKEKLPEGAHEKYLPLLQKHAIDRVLCGACLARVLEPLKLRGGE